MKHPESSRVVVFWAQALDNSAPDHIEFEGETLLPEDTKRRQDAVSLVSSVVKAGHRLYSQNGVLLTVHGDRFVLEIPSAERDRAGRTAPIILCGQHSSRVDDGLASMIIVDADDFAKRIGRTVGVEHFDGARAAFQALKKNSSRRKIAIAVGVAILVLVALGIYWVMSRSS